MHLEVRSRDSIIRYNTSFHGKELPTVVSSKAAVTGWQRDVPFVLIIC